MTRNLYWENTSGLAPPPSCQDQQWLIGLVRLEGTLGMLSGPASGRAQLPAGAFHHLSSSLPLPPASAARLAPVQRRLGPDGRVTLPVPGKMASKPSGSRIYSHVLRLAFSVMTLTFGTPSLSTVFFLLASKFRKKKGVPSKTATYLSFFNPHSTSLN